MVLFKKFVARSKENFEESLHALTIKPKVNKGKSSERLGRYQRNRFVIAWVRELWRNLFISRQVMHGSKA